MAQRKTKERVTPALLQYSFDVCSEAKLSACCQYEYLASSKLLRQTVKRFRAGQADPLAKAVALLFGPDIFWTLKGGWWPDRPYLDIPQAELRRQAQSSRQPRNLAELLTPWTHLSEAERIIVLYLPRNWPLPTLKKAFGDYLLRDYPKLLVKESVGPEWRIQKRGLGSLIEQARTDLKALSAWRLQKQFGYSAKAAMALLRAHKLSTYKEERAFYRAVKRAAKKIRALEKLLRQLAKNMTA